MTRRLASLGIILLALGLMGQARNCGEFEQTLQQVLSKADQVFATGSAAAGGGGTKIYITNLSFMNADTKSVMLAGNAELLNEAVLEAMNALSARDAKYVINAPGRSLANTDANAQRLSAIFWDPNLSRIEKVERIIAELMAPSNIDGLVAGQYHEKWDGTINVRPFVIARGAKKTVDESRSFTKQEFNCTDPQNVNRKILCQRTREDIKDAVIRLLQQL